MESPITKVGLPKQANEYFALLPKSELEALQSGIDEIKALLQNSKREELRKEWLPKSEARARLNVCQKTLDNYLSKKVIPHARFAGKIYIKASDIQAHLERHYIRA